MCKRNGVLVDHILFHCDVAFATWDAFFSCCGMFWVMFRNVVDLLNCWLSCGRPRSAVVWKMVCM
jgi:hypothetical protein